MNHVTENNSSSAAKKRYCPGCGAPVRSSDYVCPYCNTELRRAAPDNSVQIFARKMEELERQREYEKPASNLFEIVDTSSKIPKTDEQKISLIKSYPVPDTEEGMLEFMTMAASNMKTAPYGSMSPNIVSERIADAWGTKAAQIYTKAKNSKNINGDVLKKIETLYQDSVINVKKKKRKRVIKLAASCAIIFGWIPVAILVSLISQPIENRKEEARLESIVAEIYSAREAEDYALALRTAESIEYEGYDKERARWWGVQRDTLIDEIICEAEQDGIYLERSTTQKGTEEG